MEICPACPPRPERRQSVIEAKNKLRLGHDECCNCCCCCAPQPSCLKYVQPEIPKSFAPLRYYWKPDVSMEQDTVYRLSYWDGPQQFTEPIRPPDSLTVGDGPLCDITTNKASYMGNWCVKREEPITPCQKQWLGRGPIQDVTTNKHDFSWKCCTKADPIRSPDNIYCSPCKLADDTTYRLSYFPAACEIPMPSYAPIRNYCKPDVPMEGCTTYKLSYWPNELPLKEEYPWNPKREFISPTNRVDGCTTYRLSYWPHCEKPPGPQIVPDAENILNAGCCFDDKTTYSLSYFGCGGDRPDPIMPNDGIGFSPCPMAQDTVNRMSYFGNWCVTPEQPIIPCAKQFLGRGPIQDVTTNKHDFTWKPPCRIGEIRPNDNLCCAAAPLESCTTQKMSYMPCGPCRTSTPSFAPIRSYMPSNIPMECETTMKLSYQPVEPADQVPKPWVDTYRDYHPPVNRMEDNTTYNLSFIPPGTLVPLDPCCPRPCPPAVCEGMPNCGQLCPVS